MKVLRTLGIAVLAIIFLGLMAIAVNDFFRNPMP